MDNHYVVPIGYEQSPKNPEFNFTKKISDLKDEEIVTQIIVGD